MEVERELEPDKKGTQPPRSKTVLLLMMQVFKQQTVVRPMGIRLVLAMGLSGSMMIASSGLARPGDSIGIAAKPPRNKVITTVQVAGGPSARETNLTVFRERSRYLIRQIIN
jgi:hypothetical protein